MHDIEKHQLTLNEKSEDFEQLALVLHRRVLSYLTFPYTPCLTSRIMYTTYSCMYIYILQRRRAMNDQLESHSVFLPIVTDELNDVLF